MAYKLASFVLKKYSQLLVKPIELYLKTLTENSASELKEKYTELVFQLYTVSPLLVANVLPNFENELKSADPVVRSHTIQVLQKLFCAEGSTLAQNYRQLFTAIVGRFSDKEASIRANMVAFAEQYLSHHTLYAADVLGIGWIC